MPITTLPPAPSRAVPATFSALADTFLGALPVFSTEANALLANVNSKESEYIAAANSAALAASSANFKGAWSGLTGAANIPYCVSHLGRYWQLLSNLANVATKTPGTDSEWLEVGNVTQTEFRATSNPKSMSQGVNMIAVASGSTGITVVHDAKYTNTTNSCGYTIKRALPDWTPSANQLLYQKLTGGAGVQIEIVATTGVIKLTLNATAYNSSAPGFVDGTEHQIDIDISVGATNTTVSFYADGVLLSSPAAQANVDLTNTALLYVNGTSAIRYAGVVKDTLVWNRSRTAAQILSLYRNGIDFADMYGSQTSLCVNGNMELDSDWASVGTPTENVRSGEQAHGGTYSRKFTVDAQYEGIQQVHIFLPGKKYRMIAWVYGDGVNKLAVSLYDGTTSYYASGVTLAGVVYPASWTMVIIEVTTAAAAASGYLYVRSATGVTAGTWYVDDVSLVRLGATLALFPEGIKTPKWFDSSTNALDAAYPAAGSSLTLPHQPGTESLLSITTVSLAADADTTIYTVPTGRRLVLTKAILIVGADAGTTVISIGADGAETNWLPNNTLSALDAANDVGVLMPVPNTTTVLSKSYAAATVIQAKVSSQAGGATNSLQLFGVLY